MRNPDHSHRMEWTVGNKTMGYSRPVSIEEHNAHVGRLRLRNEWQDDVPQATRVIQAQAQTWALGRFTPEGAEYYFASLILEGLSVHERNARLREAGLNHMVIIP